MGGPFDGASISPAIRFGPDLVIANLSTWWAYLIGPVTGAVIAVGFTRRAAWAAGCLFAEGTPINRGASVRDRGFDSNADSNARELQNR